MNPGKTISLGKIRCSVYWLDAALYLVLFGLFLNLAFDRNFKDGKTLYGGEFWSDKGAYYIYLPATFINGFTIGNYPDSIDYRHAGGFMLDKKTGKVRTKVTYGVAFLALPFFLPTHCIASWYDLEPDGFSIIYHRMAVVCGVFYLILSMFLLKQFLRFYFPAWLSYCLPFIILLSTNLYYYGMDDVFMSHLYSFFLITLLLYLFKSYLVKGMKPFGLFVALAFTVAFLVLIRPTNILLLSVLAFWDVRSFREILDRFRHFFRIRYIITFTAVLILVFLPQSFYWHFISGKWIFFSYPGEGFTNWNKPMIIPFWFAPLNGLFPYTPFAFLFVAGLMIMIARRIPNGIYLCLVFLVYSYLFSSWHSWYFGGSFGCRPMVEFYSPLAVTAGYAITFFLDRRNLLLKTLPFLFIAATLFFNQRLFNRKIFYTGSTWGWEEYKDQMKHAGIAYFPRKIFTYINDFENVAMDFGIPSDNSRILSGTLATLMNESMKINCKYSRRISTILDQRVIGRADAGIWINPLDTDQTGSYFVCDIRNSLDSLVLYRAVPVDPFLKGANRWAEVTCTMEIPTWTDMEGTISFYLYNPGGGRFYVDDMIIRFE